ncbi:hypothetical protein [Streptomyces sp. ADI98-10]|uniref:hypothetical protein n=1 Tax=Streptomyces sp. ADI98-10 TaxID=1522763 RepID=UPI000FC2AF52|nr:hypothetical protein [Streptomyces sp. ADI98-10]RPK79662.1 hypothetical protein EES46_32035 [Streptomyces sp. ADI98-10]
MSRFIPSSPQDLERLAAVWAAKQVEWRRVAALMEQGGWDVYAPERDAQGSDWALAERRQQFLDAHADRATRWRDALVAELYLSAAAGRLVRGVVERAGLEPVQVLAQLAERVVVGEDGAVSVLPFLPSQ